MAIDRADVVCAPTMINSWSVPHIAGDLALDLIGGFPVQFLARMWGSIWQRVTRVRVLCRAVI